MEFENIEIKKLKDKPINIWANGKVFSGIIIDNNIFVKNIKAFCKKAHIKYKKNFSSGESIIKNTFTNNYKIFFKDPNIFEILKASDYYDVISFWEDNSGFNITVNSDMKFRRFFGILKKSSSPIKLIRQNENIFITAYIKFTGTNSKKILGETSKTYSQIFVEAVEKYWSGIFFQSKGVLPEDRLDDFGCDYVNVNTKIVLKNDHEFEKYPQRFINVKIGENGRGLCRYNFFWSLKGGEKDLINIYAYQRKFYYDYIKFTQLCVHEFGHLLGLGDAYQNNFGPFKNIPQASATITEETPSFFIMRDNSLKIMPNDIEMILEAFKTNKLQKYDPYSNYSNVIRSKNYAKNNSTKKF